MKKNQKIIKIEIPTLPEPKVISGKLITFGKNYSLARKVCCQLSLAAILIYLVGFIWNCYYLLIPSMLGYFIGIAIPVLLLAEITIGCGVQEETEYELNNKYFRTFEFKESISNIFEMIWCVLISIMTMLVGAASAFEGLQYDHPGVFGELEGKVDALYFSFVSLSTLGYGDLTPHEEVSKLFLVVFAFPFWIVVVLVLATLIAWSVTVSTRRVEERTQRAKERMERIERIMRERKWGLYSEDNPKVGSYIVV